jgi:serine/threonine-protein kinase
VGDRAIIDRLAESIADGGTVDWAAAASDARTEHERDLIARLRRIGDVADRGRHAAHTPHSAAGTAVAPSRGPEPARHWGHLSILEPVGKGAFGEVYRARDPKLARDVALKLLRESSSTSDAGAEVIEEGRLLARLRHPNVATVYGADRLDGYVGIWMEFINGRTLEQVLAEHGPFGADEAARIGIDLCRALGAVHQAGLVHRDVKAQNVMREDDGGRLVLMDFGTGREREQQPDAAANLSGTPL